MAPADPDANRLPTSPELSDEEHFSMHSDKDIERGSQLTSGRRTNGTQSYEVAFGEDSADPEDIARHISIVRRYYISSVITFTSMVITMVSSCWTLPSTHIIEHFHISHEVSTLGITLYVFGLGIGPLFLSPLSELYGRRTTFIYALTLSVIWQCLTIWSKTITGVMFGRFLSGFFGSAFLSVAGGAIADIFDKDQIGVPMAIFTTSAFLGPSLGPIIGGALYHENYKWTFITLLITSGCCLVIIVLTIPETYKPMLLMRKAKRLRKEENDERYYAALEVTRKQTSLLSAILLSTRRPFGLLLRDPMMGVLCFYTGLELAIVYLYFVAFPYVFKKLYDFGPMEVACSYIGIMVGMLISAPTCLLFQKTFERRVKRNNGVKTPEMRFEPLFYGAFLTPIGLFIFAFTCYKHVHWIAPIIGSAVFGSGVYFVFTGVFAYTVDAYRRYAASGMACNTFVRCIMAGVFPLFGLQMYKAMGVNWAGFLLAMVTVLMIPIPFLFTKYGARLRAKSPYAWDD
ncbi:Yhk8p [Saccharomyces eubayanus]|uniref:Yhk8p n=1 Tax=Saccharomyces eubayanus TaxID=1080349 RepID=UPI0006C124DF|nr:YHK8-like protein [Saccharomyces eubayanus]KOG99113.1 YHK8-like protein [Saccharomyces eubayanus]